MNMFDTLDGKFVARLREIASTTRSTADGCSSITFRTARVEAEYSPDVIKRIEAGRLLAIPNMVGINTNDAFSVYEIADVYPVHYSMLTLDRSQPAAIRKEFMSLIEREWKVGSKSTWIDIVAAPTGYMIKVEDGEPSFVRKGIAPLIGSQVQLLSAEMIKKFICYTPPRTDCEGFKIGNLLGVTDDELPFTVNLEKLLHYHVGLFAFTGSGKSNLTSLIVRKALSAVPESKFVIFDVSSEYGISILDVLRTSSSRVLFAEALKGDDPDEIAEDYYRRHVCPEALAKDKARMISAIRSLIIDDKVRALDIASQAEEAVLQYTTYGGLINALSDLLNEKYGAAAQKVLVPKVIEIIRGFMADNRLDADSSMDQTTVNLVDGILEFLSKAKLRDDAALKSIFVNLGVALEGRFQQKASTYDAHALVEEVLSVKEDSPKVFVVNLPEADVARFFCAKVIREVFRRRKSTFTLEPRVVFIFDEAQEFIPQEKKRDDGTDASSMAVERLLRHGRKYHLHGWISTQRIAHLNTNALQQLHSYFVSTMPRPYDRQLVSDTFAIDDAFMDRTLMFQNGDWLMTSFKATNTQNVPVFFHAFNNEKELVKL